MGVLKVGPVDNEYVLWDNVSEAEEEEGQLEAAFKDGVQWATSFDVVRSNLKRDTERIKG